MGGFYVAFHPGVALASLTPAVAAIFLPEGVLEIAVFFQFRAVPGAGWLLFDGIVALVLAYAIWHRWPTGSTWVIGILVGINLIVSGFTRLMYSVAGGKIIEAIA